MPITALDILPARTEVSSLSGSDTGYKAQGTSAGKNDGPSFSEMLEKAGQKDTTDGKVNVEDTATDRIPTEETVIEEVPVDETPVQETLMVSDKAELAKTFENQNNIVEKKTLTTTSPVVMNDVSAEKIVSDEIADIESVQTDAVDVSGAKLSLDTEIIATVEQNSVQVTDEQVSLEKPVAKEVEVPVEKTSVPQELPETAVPDNDASEYVASAMEIVANAEEQVAVKTAVKKTVETEIVAETKTTENLPSETTDVKKEKKSRFSEYESLVAMISKQAEKEAPAAMQEVLPTNPEEIAALVSNTEAASPVNEKIQVVDMRTESEHFEKHVTFDEKGNAEVSISLVPTDSAVSAKDGIETGAEGLSKADFASMLSKELETSAGDIVKTGSIVLQNNGKGSINLILHPEQLGNVKIKLELTDNQVSGKIVVASREAYDAFKENISAIKEAFSASGFEAGGFELSWGGSGDGGNQGRQEDRQLAQERSINRSGMKYVDSMPDVLPEEHVGSGNINLVA